MLEDGERVEADAIYIGLTPEYIRCVGAIGRAENQDEMSKSVEGRHETLNKRLKHFKCLAVKYKGRRKSMLEKAVDHGNMFSAVAVITQVAMELGYSQLYKLDESYS
jgi:hypothetical protein